MRRFSIVYFHELRNLLRFKITWALAAAMLVFMTLIPLNIVRQMIVGAPDIRPILSAFVQFHMFHFSFPVALMLNYSLLPRSFVEEKLRRVTEVLLTTPLGTWNIWLGKSTALFTFCYAVSLAALFSFCVVCNLVFVRTPPFVWPDWPVLVQVLVVAPLLVWSLICAVSLGQLLLSDSRIVALLLFGTSFSYIMGAAALGQKIGVTWTLVGLYAACTVGVLALVLWAARRWLVAERIVLST